jgi:hypothetical protein
MKPFSYLGEILLNSATHFGYLISYTAEISAGLLSLSKHWPGGGWEGPGTVRPLPNMQIADIHVELQKYKLCSCTKAKLFTIFVLWEKNSGFLTCSLVLPSII